MQKRVHSVIVIGISAGGIRPLQNLLKQLPRDCQASIFIVQHIPAHTESSLAKVLASGCPLSVQSAVHQQPIEPGNVYTAISDHHLLVEDGKILVTKGPRENHWRPSIDALFRSAAYAYKEKVIGVILSGALNDGTSGMWRIKQFGGTTVIQDRDEATFNDMPNSVAAYVEIDYEKPSNEIGELLGQLSKNMDKNNNVNNGVTKNEREMDFTRFEIGVAKGENALKNGVIEYGKPSSLACPECHGALTEYTEGSIKRFRCHTGHAHTSESLLAGIDTNIEKSIWEVMRGMEEGQLLLNQLADNMEKNDDSETAVAYRRRAAELAQRSQMVKELIFNREAVTAVLNG